MQLSLLRERFTITPAEEGEAPISVLSNRLRLSDPQNSGPHIIVRASTMPICTRFSAKILQKIKKNAMPASQWSAQMWDELAQHINGIAELTGPVPCWFSAYQDGRLLSSQGKHPAFLDLVEQKDAAQGEDHTESFAMVEDMLKKAGKNVSIDYDSNIGLIIHRGANHEARCGLILRDMKRNATFNYAVHPMTEDQELGNDAVLENCADWLEALQLVFLFRYGKKGDTTAERKSRLEALEKRINVFENSYKVNYRPDRPDLSY